jgi:DNA helicase-2/ATP-dependent DNA helicase PcrA
MQEILQSLNKEQIEAVLHSEGTLLLLSGAGTGKTRVLTSKIAYLIKTNLAYPSQILAVTFTNKAANEMKERVALMTGLDVNSLWINTFHSIAARILRQHGNLVGLDKDFTIIDQGEQTIIVKQIMQNLGMDVKEYSPKQYVEMISKIKDKMSENPNYSTYKSIEIYESYQEKLKKSNMCDFGDLLRYNIKLFGEHDDVKKYYNDRFKYILVDEYQDTNYVQHRWLQMISGADEGKNVNITCVGDDDQSIYGWRGAEINNILKFTNDYRKAKILKLERNYRSTQNILSAASTLISHNKNRHGKTLYANDKDRVDKIKLIKCNDSKQEAIVIVNEIEKLKETGTIDSYKKVGILVRAGYQTRIFEDVFLKYGIPYLIIGGLKFYERKEIKDCIAYLRLIKNKNDDIAFERVINVPRRGIGSITIGKIKEKAVDDELSLFESSKNLCRNGTLKGKTKDEVVNFITKISEWQENSKTATLKNLMQIILQDTKIVDFFEREDDIEAKNKIENINEFLHTLEDFNDIQNFLEYVSLVNDKSDKNTINAVNIMTIHSAKGLEFDVVFLPNWQEGVFPSPKSLEEKNGLEEERRLGYVAITRAKNKLYISYSKFRYEYGEISATDASRFVGELPENELEKFDHSSGDNYYYSNYYNSRNSYRNGCAEEKSQKSSFRKKCIHKTFGKGYVVAEDGDKLTIAFENLGEKVIMRNFVEIL